MSKGRERRGYGERSEVESVGEIEREVKLESVGKIESVGEKMFDCRWLDAIVSKVEGAGTELAMWLL